MIMISSVSVYPSYKITSIMVQNGRLDEASNSYYLIKNIGHVFIGLFLAVAFSKIPFQFFEKYANVFYFIAMNLMFVVLFVWDTYNGARWWLNIPWLPSLQPVEFAKIALIIFLAHFLKKNSYHMNELWRGFFYYFWWVSILMFLLMFQPDFWSILIITPVILALFFIGWWNVRYMSSAIALLFVLAFWVYSVWKAGESKCTVNPNTQVQVCKNSVTYISRRIDNFLTNSKDAITKKTIAFQTEQWLIAIWSGGFGGLWFWKSIQKFWYLPEAQGDFIFSVVAEELWFIGVFTLFSIYLFILSRGLSIARRVKDPFWKYLAFWISILIIMQAFINIWVNMNVVPLTWITLPFVSYGWSSLVSLLIGVGILLNISRSTEYTQKLEKSPWMRRKVS